MKAEKEKPASVTAKPISITRNFNRPVNQVWKAWTDEESLQKWWGPKDFTCPYCTVDFVEGGKYLSCMKAPDGNEMWSTGIYLEIIPHERIVLSDCFSDKKGNVISAKEVGMPGNWPLQLLVTLEFEENNGSTKMTLLHEGVPAEMYEDCIKGWNESLDKLEKSIS